MPNMGQILSKHNAKISKQGGGPDPPAGCNCRGGPTTCPLEGQCLTKELVYQATVVRTDTQHKETYTGLTGGTFKDRFNHHNSNFRNQYIWKLKRQGFPYEISWKKLARGNPVTRTCHLCLQEKYLIMFSPQGATIDKRSELYNTCRHSLKDLVGNMKT